MQRFTSTALVVHDEGHACALKTEQKCFIFNSHRNSLNGTQELNLSGEPFHFTNADFFL